MRCAIRSRIERAPQPGELERQREVVAELAELSGRLRGARERLLAALCFAAHRFGMLDLLCGVSLS